MLAFSMFTMTPVCFSFSAAFSTAHLAAWQRLHGGSGPITSTFTSFIVFSPWEIVSEYSNI
jgi:hypothetical protein